MTDAANDGYPAPVNPPVMKGPPAGWYPDPNGGRMRRYWDGEVWTSHTRTMSMVRWARAGNVAKWVAIGWVALFLLVIVIGVISR